VADMPDPIQASVTYDDIGTQHYIDYDETLHNLDPLNQMKGRQINAGVTQDSISSIYDNTIEGIVGKPLITKRFSNIEAPPEFSDKNTRIFHQSTLIDHLSRENLLDVDMDRIQASSDLSSDGKKKVIDMLKSLESLAKLQENAYFETRRYNKG
jgi:hypothetical protein